MEWYLPVIWAGLIGVSVAMYVILDGFDLGIGILFPFTKTEAERDQMMRSIAPGDQDLARVGRIVHAGQRDRLGAELAPAADLWSVTGESRVRAGVEGRVVLLVPLGGVSLENRIGVGFSGSPIEASDLGQVAEERGLWTLLVGLGMRTGL